MTKKITDITDFLLQLDTLKTVERRSYINGGHRLENSAEHSWHLAMACWAFAEYLSEDYDIPKLIQLALIHDLGEIGAGDTMLYDENRDSAHVEERKYIEQITAHPGNPIHNLMVLWDEQEYSDNREVKLLKVVDRLLPFLLNLSTQGKTWQENGIKRSQVIAKHQFIERENPEIHCWLLQQLEYAVEQGWLEA